MEEITITLKTLLAIFSELAVIGGGTAVIVRMLSPFRSLKKQVGKHAELLSKDNQRLIAVEQGNRIICKSMLALLDHEITGNSVEKLKATRQELQNYLIER